MNRLLPAFLFISILYSNLIASQVYISPDGNDLNEGTINKPKATLNAALRQVRELRRTKPDSLKGSVNIILKGGIYTLHEPVFIRPEDSGTEESPTIITKQKNEKPVLSGGIKVGGWKKLLAPVKGLSGIAKEKVWVADVPMVGGRLFEFRQLWVNDVKAIWAKSANGQTMHRILNWNKKNETAIIPSLNFSGLDKENSIEMFIHQWWEIANLRVRKMQVTGDSTILYFHQPESRIQSEHPWPAPWLSAETGNSAFYLTNSIQFLDDPGEWYLDVAKQKLYYWPRAGENLATAKVVAPHLETLLSIEGTGENPVKNIVIDGIDFKHTSWLRPSQQGHVPHQAGMYMTDAYKLAPKGTKNRPALDNQAWVGRPAAAIEINFAENINILNASFENMASTGLDYHKGVKNSVIEGNLFNDIGGTAILAGVFNDKGHEVHVPYNPKDEREITENIAIRNNFITDATNEDWGTVGIGAGYVKNITISNNHIENISYSGISIGWGWTPQPNVMRDNKIISNKIYHYGKHNYDCAGIYTLSAQPGSVIEKNYVDSIYKAPYAHLPNHWFYLYTDEGSAGITVRDNWTPSEKFLQNNNGPGNVWKNNGPNVSDEIKLKAGLEPEFRHLLKYRSPADKNLSINH